MDKKAYVFDLDGTLLDSMTKGWKNILHGYLDERGVSYPSNLMGTVAPLGLYKLCEYYQEHFLPDIPAGEMYQVFTARMKKEYDHTILLKPNVEELLLKLKAQGVSLNVLTAGVHQLFDGCLKRLGVEKYFDHIWSTEDFSLKKNDPAIYAEVANRLGVEAENCVMVDDNVNALKTAKQAGFYTIGIYDEVEKEKEQEMLASTDRYIYDFKELL